MHSQQLDDGLSAHYNGDFSGHVVFTIDPKKHSVDHDFDIYSFSVPAEALLSLMKARAVSDLVAHIQDWEF